MPNIEDLVQYLPVVPSSSQIVVALVGLCIGLVLAVVTRRALAPDSPLGHRLPEDARDVVPTWVPRLFVLWGIAFALDVTEILPVREGMEFLHWLLMTPFLEVADKPIALMDGVVFIVVLVITSRLSMLSQQGVARVLAASEDADAGVIAALQRLTHYAVLALGFVFGLQMVGFSLSALLAASAVLGVGLAFGLQTIVENFLSGLILLFERSIRPGDMLTIDGHVVQVKEMGIRASVCKTLDESEIIVPNARLVSNSVLNHSTSSPVVRARGYVGVAYDSDVDATMAVLQAAAEGVSRRQRERQPTVLLNNFADSAIEFEINIWVRDAFSRPAALSEMRVAIWRALRDAEIEIAFPQIDVHFDEPVVEGLRAVGAQPR